MNNKIIDISVKRAQLKKSIKDNSILFDDVDEYMLYKKNMTNFVNVRNQRILILK